MNIISRLFYGGADMLFAAFLLFVAQPIPWSDSIALFLASRAAMTLIGVHLTPYTLESKIFYGCTDILAGIFFTTNVASLGDSASAIGMFMMARGTMTCINIEI